MSVLKRPIITEKTAGLMDMKVPQYGFEVALTASKDEIKAEIERVFGVEVLSVNTMIKQGKARRRFSKKGVINGKSSNEKRAIVTLREGFEIDFYKHI